MVELLYATILLSRSQQTPSPFERTFNPILLLKQQQVTKAREKGPFPCVIRGFDSIGWLYALHIVLCATFGQGWFPSAASGQISRNIRIRGDYWLYKVPFNPANLLSSNRRVRPTWGLSFPLSLFND